MEATTNRPTARSCHPRFAGLPLAPMLGRIVPVAVDRRSRLLGLAGLELEEAGPGLLLPACRAVHTFGMRFAIDLVFLDAALRPLGARRAVGPGRLAFSPGARAVLELPAFDQADRRAH